MKREQSENNIELMPDLADGIIRESFGGSANVDLAADAIDAEFTVRKKSRKKTLVLAIGGILFVAAAAAGVGYRHFGVQEAPVSGDPDIMALIQKAEGFTGKPEAESSASSTAPETTVSADKDLPKPAIAPESPTAVAPASAEPVATAPASVSPPAAQPEPTVATPSAPVATVVQEADSPPAAQPEPIVATPNAPVSPVVQEVAKNSAEQPSVPKQPESDGALKELQATVVELQNKLAAEQAASAADRNRFEEYQSKMAQLEAKEAAKASKPQAKEGITPPSEKAKAKAPESGGEKVASKPKIREEVTRERLGIISILTDGVVLSDSSVVTVGSEWAGKPGVRLVSVNPEKNTVTTTKKIYQVSGFDPQ